MSVYSNSKPSVFSRKSFDYANELNQFYNRFDCYDFTDKVDELLQLPSVTSDSFLTISEKDVRLHFNRLNPSKAAGPDHVSPRILKNCSSQLAFIFTYIFNLCFTNQEVPYCTFGNNLVLFPYRKSQ